MDCPRNWHYLNSNNQPLKSEMSKSNHTRSDVNQKRVETIDDRYSKVRERQIRQTLHNLNNQFPSDDGFDDYLDDLDLDCRDKKHHKVTLK